MKIGSVAFFKKLIVTVFILILVVPIGLAVLFGVLYAGQKGRAERLEAAAQSLMDSGLQHAVAQADGPAVTLTPEVTLPPLATQQPAFEPEASFDYQTRYPHMYAPTPLPQPTEGKVCYLTFDDGPSPVTWQVLRTLEDYGIKATFFVTGENSVLNEDALKAAAEAGHTIGVHTYSHEYAEIYESVDAYLDDFEKMYTRIIEVTGVAPTVFRFAGGSLNVHNQFVYNDIIAEMVRRGFVFFDWNVAANDAVVGGVTRQQVIDSVLGGAAERERIVVLMHDRQDNVSTASALPTVIDGLLGMGFRFEPLGPQVQPITYFYRD